MTAMLRKWGSMPGSASRIGSAPEPVGLDGARYSLGPLAGDRASMRVVSGEGNVEQESASAKERND